MQRRFAIVVLALVIAPACGGSTALPPASQVTSAPSSPTSAGPIGTDAPPTRVTLPPRTTVPAIPAEPWQNLTGNLAGIESECGNLSTMSVRPDGDEVLAGVARVGLYRSDADGAEWEPLGTSPGSAPMEFRPSTVVYDPADRDRYWVAGFYDGPGVLRTDDGGESFTALTGVGSIESVAVDFTDPQRSTLLAGGRDERALAMSTNGGATWADVTAGLPAESGATTSPVVLDARTFLVGTTDGTMAGIYRSTDRSQTWTQVLDGGVVGVPVIRDGSIWWLREAGLGVVRSDDGGETWQNVGGYGWVTPTARSLVALPDGGLASLGNGIVIVSFDGGVSWRPVGVNLPFDPDGLVYSAARATFYLWHAPCLYDQVVPVLADAIAGMRVDPTDLRG